MISRSIICALLAMAAPVPVWAGRALSLPDGVSVGFDEIKPDSSVALPIGPFENGTVTTLLAQGNVDRQVWRTQAPNTETLDLILPLRQQLLTQGYSVLFECETRSCGGFDFRFETDVVAEPDMHVDLGDFRYLAAKQHAGTGDKYVSILVSRSGERGYVQITNVGGAIPKLADVTVSTMQSDAAVVEAPVDLGGQLAQNGSAVLQGLEFANGKSSLTSGTDGALRELADYLNADPSKQVILVGHTDATGSLSGNIALSRKRANSVMQELIDTYGVTVNQVSAQGVGFLAPRASNATDAGREKNRCVEVVLISKN